MFGLTGAFLDDRLGVYMRRLRLEIPLLVSSNPWLNVLHLVSDTDPHQPPRAARHAGGVAVTTAADMDIQASIVLQAQATVAASGPAALRGLVGPSRVPGCHTRPHKCFHSPQFATQLKRKQRYNRICGTVSCVTLGTTVKTRQKSCMICWRLPASRFGSAKKTSDSESR